MVSPPSPRLRVLVGNSPADSDVERAYQQLRDKHSDVEFEQIFLSHDREECKSVFRALDHSQHAQRAAYLHFGWLHLIAPINADLLGPVLGPHLQMITSGGAGYDHIHIEDLNQHKVSYCNTPGAVATPTAEYTALLILQLLRQSRTCDRVVRTQAWGAKTGKVSDRGGMRSSKSPRNCVLGIVGLGTIGKIVAHRMQAFGMRCLYFNRRRLPPQEEQEAGVEYVESLDKLLQQCDVLSLHLPLSPATRHLIGREQLALMKPGSYLVNTARGAVCDDEALVEALQSGHLAGAGLDCFEDEPRVHPGLLAAENVILSPHVGATVEEVMRDIHLEEIAVVDAFLSTGTPLNVCN